MSDNTKHIVADTSEKILEMMRDEQQSLAVNALLLALMMEKGLRQYSVNLKEFSKLDIGDNFSLEIEWGDNPPDTVTFTVIIGYGATVQ